MPRAALFCGVLLLPTVWLNSADWGQCDSMYAAFAALSLGAVVRNRRAAAVVLAAVAFSVKLQTVFFLPLGLVLLLRKRLRLRDLVWFPVTYLAMIAPALCFGRPFLPTLMIYANQTQSYSSQGLQWNAPSVFALFPRGFPVETGILIGLIAAGSFVAGLTAWLWRSSSPLSNDRIYAAAAAFCVAVPFLLPSMHDRYFFLADALTLGLAFIAGSRPAVLRGLITAACVQMGSYTAYFAYLNRRWLWGSWELLPWGFRYSMAPGAVFMLLGGICVLYLLLSRPPEEEEPQQG
jgi:Gpi18-like mannosyltransferase